MIDLNTMSVMIVDDMESMRKSIRGMLKVLKYGKNIRLASNGREGWNLLNSVPVDLAIIDWNMPVMKGIELLDRIRSSDEYRDMPVIMITAEAEIEIVAEAAESDIDGYLLKPLTTQSLDERLQSVVKLANNPDPATLHLLKGRKLEEEDEDVKGAIEEVKQALRLRPDSSRILRRLGQLYTRLGVDEIAEKCLLKAVAVNQHDAMSRYILAELFLAKNELAKAVKYYDEAITISPRNIKKGMELGDVLLKSGMRNEAMDIFNKVVQYSNKGLADSEEVAKKCLQNGETRYAKTLLENIVQEKPDRYDLLITLGDICQRTGELDEAITYYSQVDENNPENIGSKLNLARIYMRQKKMLVADRYLNKILKINPKHPEAMKLSRDNF